MNRADQWLSNVAPNPQPGSPEQRGMDTARLISARPFQVTMTRKTPGVLGHVALPVQTVRIELVQNIRGSSEHQNPQIDISEQYVVLIGYKDNPNYPDTDILRGDYFFYGGLQYEVIEFINTVPGRLLASAQATP
jgi:hypothetical protein